jgi:perosamine synthetase
VAGVFAFYPNKQITTGEGGAIITDDPELARLCRSMRNQGRADGGGWLSHERLGYNYRLPEICCALGIVQLDRIDEFLDRRDKVAAAYIQKLSPEPRLIGPYLSPDTTRMSWFVFVVRLTDDCTRADRDGILQELRRHGVGANNYFQPIHLQPFYQEQFGFAPGAFPITEAIADRTIALPFHNNITPDEIELVTSRLHDAIHTTCLAG